MSSSSVTPSRRRLAPEVVQTSAMDCGPATLKCLLEGHGIPISYGRLREACQTDVDGTSIDTLEAVATQLGLEATQAMAPVDHMLRTEAGMLPALVVVRQPDGMTHFVVAWRRNGHLVQIMDPALGRRWIPVRRFQADLYHHEMPVAAAQWRRWAGSEGLRAPLTAQLRALGLRATHIQPLLDSAEGDAGWRGYAALDATTRMVAALVDAGGLRRGVAARRLLRTTFERLTDGASDDLVPDAWWSVRPAPRADDGTPQVRMCGAVLIQVSGRRATTTDLPSELAAAIAEAPPHPGRTLWRLLREDGVLAPATLTAALGLAAATVLAEAILFRSLFDLAMTLGAMSQRLAAMGLLAVFLIAQLGLQGATGAGLLGLGRRLEARLRLAFLSKIPRLADRYFKSRPISDMAERGHALHPIRRLPILGGGFLRAAFELILTAAGIAWLAPSAAPLAFATAAFALAWPLLTQPALAEQDLRFQTHTGAIGRFYLDALLGLTALRTHGAERAVQRAHEGLLVTWAEAGLRLQRTLVGIEGIQQVVGFGLAAWMLALHLHQGATGTALLLVYWALHLPVLSETLALHVRQYPMLRNKTLRLLEPLGAQEDGVQKDVAQENVAQEDVAREGVAQEDDIDQTPPGVALAFDGVRVSAGGHTILEGIDLHVPAGQHVAIVGPSGAGKSSLTGLLLGWHRAAEGTVRVDGALLDGPRLEALRRETAWVDPATQLWNTTLFENLLYASDGTAEEPVPLGDALTEADLRGVLQQLPEGLQTPLGEGGGRLSGGEGQRIRFGRALLQGAPRLVLLDEAFRGLDHDQRRNLLARARARWCGATLLCITHDIADTQDFDRVLVIENGRVEEDAAPTDLLQRPSRYRALLEQDVAARQALWTDPQWRRLHLAHGALRETVRAPSETVPAPAATRSDLLRFSKGEIHAQTRHSDRRRSTLLLADQRAR